MDCYSAAASLKKLLVVHSAAETQVTVLDDEIDTVSQHTMISSMDGNRSHDLHLSLRLSVCEGVKVMYQNYQNKKWSQVQATARDIIESLEGDLDTEQTASSLTSPGGSNSVDKAAGKWTMAFSEFYRGS